MSFEITCLVATLLMVALLSPYTLFPYLLRRLRPARFGHPLPPQDKPVVSVLIPANNEAASIAAKIENTLALDWPADRLEIIVGSDGSTDETEALVAGFADRGVRLVASTVRRGKSATLMSLVKAAKGSLVVFTDATTTLPEHTVCTMVARMSDPTVGAVGARYATDASDERVGEAGYWRGVTNLHDAASLRDVPLGLHGAGYMIRRSLVPQIPADTVNDDFVIPLAVHAAGLRVRYLSDVVVTEPPTAELSTVYHRMVRIAAGNLQMLWRSRGLLRRRTARAALSLGAYKLPKTLSPWLLAGLAACVTLLAVQLGRPLLSAVVWGPVALGALSLAWVGSGRRAPRVVRLAAYAAMSQFAYLEGTVRFCFGQRPWRRSEAAPLDIDGVSPPPLSVRVLKRGIDVVASTIGLVLGAPIMAVVAVAIRVDSAGPAIYAQRRLGSDGLGQQRTFTMYKFRSMRQDAEAASGPVWAAEHDPRITRLGAWLRKLRLDELPQLLNVLRGDMSLVGPRPERPSFTEKFDVDVHGYRDRVLRCRPGITGWAQVNCAYDTSVDSVRHKLAYDLAYAAHLNGVGAYLKMEGRVLLRTVAVCLTGSGAR